MSPHFLHGQLRHSSPLHPFDPPELGYFFGQCLGQLKASLVELGDPLGFQSAVTLECVRYLQRLAHCATPFGGHFGGTRLRATINRHDGGAGKGFRVSSSPSTRSERGMSRLVSGRKSSVTRKALSRATLPKVLPIPLQGIIKALGFISSSPFRPAVLPIPDNAAHPGERLFSSSQRSSSSTASHPLP